MLRSLICTFVGHVDHGKTSIQDFIRGTCVVKQEAGLITQHISYTNLKFDKIKKVCGNLINIKEIKIPGLLFLDTPGHASFTNLRKRGGNLADIAILVVDVNEGFKPQTLEALEILKSYKTPFVIAANKIDLISGYRTQKKLLIETLKLQSDTFQERLDKKIYELVGRLSELNIISERFDRVEDYTKQVAIIPVSAKTGDGIPELLMVLAGLAQKFLEKELEVHTNLPAKAIVLEVKEEKGLGTVLEVIVYDGTIKINDTIVIGGLKKPIVTKVKSMFIYEKGKNISLDKASAAMGVKLIASDVEEVFPGMPLLVAKENIDKLKKQVQEEVNEVLIETDKEGVVIKADSLGSLEALINLLKSKNIGIKKADIGDITKKDIAIASSEKNPLNKVILAFNVKQLEKADELKVINHDVIYKIIDEYESWLDSERKKIESKELAKITMPCKILLMPGYVFRQSNPAVVGVEVLAGTLKVGMPLMKDGKEISEVKSIQEESKNINEAKKGKEVAVALLKVIVGRQISSGDILYSSIKEEDFRKLKKLKKYLTNDELLVLKEIAEIKRKENPMWGI